VSTEKKFMLGSKVTLAREPHQFLEQFILLSTPYTHNFLNQDVSRPHLGHNFLEQQQFKVAID